MRYDMRKGGGSLLSGASVSDSAIRWDRGPNPALPVAGSTVATTVVRPATRFRNFAGSRVPCHPIQPIM